MHNRVKTRTSEELQALNKKKEQEKAEIYKSIMKTVREKRNVGEYDEELMNLTAEIIHMNPDISTIWNIRRECLLKTANKETSDANTIIEPELKLTEAGLRINPKSYCAWYHRCWVLNNFGSKSNWMKELKICTGYLELDERNFHCWDYRKYVVERLDSELNKELDYSYQKLCNNFSNYSAWHYRSKLIPRVYSIFEREKLLQSDIYQQEVSLVENAVYTDPNDQSAWFYYRWLLGCISHPVQFVQAGYDKINGTAWVVIFPFSSSVKVKSLGNSEWKSLNGKKFSNVFVTSIEERKEFSESINLYDGENNLIDSVILTNETDVTRNVNFKSILTPEESTSLRRQLESYQKLIQLEGDNKWALLSVVILKQKLGEEIDISVFEKLKANDKYRRNYYSDLYSKYQMELMLSAISDWHGSFLGKELSLTAFYHAYCFTLFQEVDLSDNPFGNDVMPKLDVLLSCRILKLSNCFLTSIDNFPTLPNLRTLDVSRNEIACERLPCSLLKSPFLESLNFIETFISKEVCEAAIKSSPNVKIMF